MAVSRRTNQNVLANEIATHGNGPFEAIVVSTLDPNYQGGLLVDILRRSDAGSIPEKIGNSIEARYLSPFYGTTGFQHTQGNDGYSSTQKSYGFWAVPPDPGTRVLVLFVNGDISRCYWIGCIQDAYMNFMVPDGRASTEITTDATPSNLKGSKLPVGEYNKKIETGTRADPTKFKKPYNKDFTQVLEIQGLIQDEARGLTTTSARRDLPSSVYGWSTPGPIDKRNGAPKGQSGQLDARSNRFVNRLGGASIVMDDGDDKLLRKTTAEQGPPSYVNVEGGETGGDPTLPQNELTRLRTRSGHQILMHNTEDFIYIGNSRGTAWIELSSDGKIDVYANDSVSIHSDNDLNFTADRDVNIEGGRNVNIRASARFSDGLSTGGTSGNVQIESKNDMNLRADENMKIHVESNRDDYTKGTHNSHVIGEINTTTDASFKLHATGGTVDLKASGGINAEATSGNINVKASAKVSLGAGTNIDLQADTQLAGDATTIYWNSGQSAAAGSANDPADATEVALLKTHGLPVTNPGVFTPDDVNTIVRRMPSHEPWSQHENLDPLKFKKAETDQQNTSPFIDTINIRTPDTFQKSGAGGTREAGGFGAAPSVNGTAPVTVTPDYSSVGPGGDLLNIIAQAESGANYDTVFSNSRITTKEYLGKDLSACTITEVLQWGDHSTDVLGSASSAAGKYQIIRSTLRSLVAEGAASVDEVYNAEVQDRLANALLRRRRIAQYIAGSITEARFAINIAQEWASMPVCSRTQGKFRMVNAEESYYAGDGLNKSLVATNTVIAAIRALRPAPNDQAGAPPTRNSGPQ